MATFARGDMVMDVWSKKAGVVTDLDVMGGYVRVLMGSRLRWIAEDALVLLSRR